MESGDKKSASREDSDGEEVTETLVVGVTESGVLRKRSVKRKVTKEEKCKLRGYGNSKFDYDAITAKVLEQKMVRESIDTLKERLKMVVLMRDDCMDLVSQWETTRDKQERNNKAFDLEFSMLFIIGILILVCLFFIRWYVW